MKIYAVVNSEGKYFHPRGYNKAYHPQWVDSVEKARFYSKIGQARARVTFFKNAFPDYDAPEILEFTLSEPVIVK